MKKKTAICALVLTLATLGGEYGTAHAGAPSHPAEAIAAPSLTAEAARPISADTQKTAAQPVDEVPLPNKAQAIAKNPITDAQPNTLSPEEQTYLDNFLIVVTDLGKTEFVRRALAAGADVHVKDDLPLFLAAMDGHTEVVKVLLATGADLHANNDEALWAATFHGHKDVVKLLKANVARPVCPALSARAAGPSRRRWWKVGRGSALPL